MGNLSKSIKLLFYGHIPRGDGNFPYLGLNQGQHLPETLSVVP